MNVCIRTDASIEIGSGHVIRCLTLAEALRDKGVQVVFICRELSGNLTGLIEAKGFRVYRLLATANVSKPIEGTRHANWLGFPWQTDAEQVLEVILSLPPPDWLIVDHYALDNCWEEKLRSYVGKIMVIDDLADRHHEADLLLDQNLYIDFETRYSGLVPNRCKLLLGPKYALLRPEFGKARRQLRVRDGIVRRIMIFFGGSDPSNLTTTTLQALQMLNRSDIVFDIIVGSTNPRRSHISTLCKGLLNTQFYCQIDNIAEIMASADLAIGGGGSTTWERMCLGLPTASITLAQNQLKLTEDLFKIGAIEYLGYSDDVNADLIFECLCQLINDKTKLNLLSRNCITMVDGNGCSRVIENILKVT